MSSITTKLICPIIIGIIGDYGNGKTTVSEYLQKKYLARVVTIAQRVKEICKIFGYSDKELNGSDTDKNAINYDIGLSGRGMMIAIGENMKKIFGTDIWIKLILNELQTNIVNSKTDNLIVFSDLRFDIEKNKIEEFANINNMKFYIIKVVNENTDEKSKDMNNIEKFVYGYEKWTPDIVIINKKNGLSELYKQIDKVFDELLRV